jgi:hypothetical protein
MSKNVSYVESLESLELKDDIGDEKDMKIDDNIHNIEDIKTDLDIPSIRSKCTDLFLPQTVRLKHLYLLYTLIGDDINETVSSIIGMYFFSRTTVLSDYLEAIVRFDKIPMIHRIECAKNLENGRNYLLIDYLFQNELTIDKVAVPIYIQTIFYLMHSEEFKLQARDYFCKMLETDSLDNLYKYKTIQRLENEFNVKNVKIKDEAETKRVKEMFRFYAQKSCFVFLRNDKNSFTYRILCCQYLFEKCDISDNEEVEAFLIRTASDVSLDQDVRADACDVILQYTSDETKQKARMILFELGGGNLSRNNIYKNAQNVHVRSIEESVQRVLEKLSMYHSPSNKVYDFDLVKTELMERAQILTKEDRESVIGSITRIIIDRSVYGSSNMSLATILTKVWTYIQDSEHREELENILLQELVDSNNKCSSGYASRIVNSLSGFDENMTITISYEDQIVANLEAHLNRKIMEMEDKELADIVLEEMTIPIIDYHKRRNFLNFFRGCISRIREDMYNEYCKYMEDIDYDMYFRKAIMHYEGVNSM